MKDPLDKVVCPLNMVDRGTISEVRVVEKAVVGT